MNNVAVPQGAILLPSLFNLVIRGLAVRPQQIHGIQFTICADDVTL